MLQRQWISPQSRQQRCLQAAPGRFSGSPGQPLHAAPRQRDTPGRCAAVKEFQMGRVFSGGKEANWFAPEGDPKAAKGVVLFMHGFAQGPNAYYENLQGLAEAGFLVVAPVPPFGATRNRQQTSMVDYAAHFHSKIVSNSLTGLPLSSAAVANIGLLGHSVGAGLATYVAQQAAAQGKPFKAVMFMAPQTEVVDKYEPEAAIKSWPAKHTFTEFSLQYGLKDDLAPPDLSLHLVEELRKKGLSLKPDNLKPFDKGTHVGFQDQVVLGDAEVASDILPWLNLLLLWLITALSSLGVPFLPLGLRSLYRQKQAAAGLQLGAEQGAQRSQSRMDRLFGKAFVNPQDIALLEQQVARTERTPVLRGQPADGIADPEEVSIASAEASIAQYVGLLTVTVAAGFFFASKAFKDGEVHWLPLLGTLVAGYMTYEGAFYLSLQNYVNTVQRPKSREKAREFFTQYLQ